MGEYQRFLLVLVEGGRRKVWRYVGGGGFWTNIMGTLKYPTTLSKVDWLPCLVIDGKPWEIF